MEMFFDIMSHRPEMFAGFLELVICCNILRSKCLQSRHLLGVLRNRYHRVIPIPESLGDLLSVRRQRRGGKTRKETLFFTWERDCPIVRVSGRASCRRGIS